jgi:hypothetical protein
VRNLNAQFGAPLGTVPAASTQVLTLPRTPAGDWTLRFASAAPLRVCSAAASPRGEGP